MDLINTGVYHNQACDVDSLSLMLLRKEKSPWYMTLR